MTNSPTQRKINRLQGFSRHMSFHASPAIGIRDKFFWSIECGSGCQHF